MEKKSVKVGLHVGLNVQGRNGGGGGHLFCVKKTSKEVSGLIQIGGVSIAVLQNVTCFTVLRSVM